MGAWLLKRTALSLAGINKKLVWKAWRDDDASQLKWELRRVLPACGYIEKSRDTSVKNVVKGQIGSWTHMWQSCGLEVDETFGRSRASRCQLARQMDNSAAAGGCQEQDYWVSTQGLLAMLNWWTLYRRGEGKLDAQDSLRMFLLIGHIVGHSASPVTSRQDDKHAHWTIGQPIRQ